MCPGTFCHCCYHCKQRHRHRHCPSSYYPASSPGLNWRDHTPPAWGQGTSPTSRPPSSASRHRTHCSHCSACSFCQQCWTSSHFQQCCSSGWQCINEHIPGCCKWRVIGCSPWAATPNGFGCPTGRRSDVASISRCISALVHLCCRAAQRASASCCGTCCVHFRRTCRHSPSVAFTCARCPARSTTAGAISQCRWSGITGSTRCYWDASNTCSWSAQ